MVRLGAVRFRARHSAPAAGAHPTNAIMVNDMSNFGASDDSTEDDDPPTPTDPVYRQIEQLLRNARETVVDDRNETHGHPRENLQHTADMWSAYLQTDVSATDVAMCMVMQKISRQKIGKPIEDHYEDMDGYAAIGGALALRDED